MILMKHGQVTKKIQRMQEKYHLKVIDLYEDREYTLLHQYICNGLHQVF